MDTRQAVLADAFAADPTGGVPVAVLPDGTDLADEQLRAVARELAAPATAVPTDGPPESLRAVGPEGPADPRAVAVAAFALAAERGWLDTGGEDDTAGEGGTDYGPTVAGSAREVTVDADGHTWVDSPEPNPQEADADAGTIADALGIDVAALRDVGADLPPVRLTGGVEALAVPVNFLEHLGSATVDPAALADLAESASVAVVCAFTFDTLAADAACHARTFVPPDGDGTGGAPPWMRETRQEVPAIPSVAAGIATHLSREGIIEVEKPIVECGHYLDRPGRVHADPGTLRVGGRAIATVDGTVTVPPAGDDEIIEL